MLSTNSECVIHEQQVCDLLLFSVSIRNFVTTKKPLETDFSISTEKASIPSTNRYGDSGSPYLSSLELLKKPARLPLIKIENEAIEVHHLNQLTHLFPNPIFCNIENKIFQLI